MPAFGQSDLPDLHVFATIARRRSFTLAAIELGVTTSALSHRIKKLEARLGVRLLHRTNRTVMPTAVGERLAERLGHGFEAIEHALGEIEAFRANPAGELRINVPRDASRLLIAPVLAEFTAAYPGVQLVLAVEDRPVDIVAEGFDAGIRYGGTVPEDMVAMPLTAPLRWVVVGSPAYLAAHGRPRSPEDLLDHACIRVRLGDNSIFRWELGDGEAMVRLDVKGPFAVNETDATIDAVLHGVGLGYVLERRVVDDIARGALEIVLPEWASVGPPFYAYYPSRKHSEPGLSQLIEMIRTREQQRG
ncbi:LysR family transcriptional regulator [Novosphingobium sp. FSW06-99]|uniref:LysR family transcriptional regulator n=1 Tax=Novosphingobium sp. FSW06-99 TaxID=1739113 RepID=UPI00076CA0CF|nr:LysR family transcriptional regulator [Novosphingobium sp. FSW06-99]KUR74876.1 LysR family transcriptional regulator [Novosphingobium sp. FSW06-99]